MSETATVTVLFTDVVGSTALRQHQGETLAHDIMNAHNEIVRRQIRENAGHEIKTIGDSFMATFESARRAVECAVAVQRALHDYNRQHPGQPLKIRIGLHTGEVIRAANDLFGTSVDAAARIMAKAEGEEILVSDTLKSILGASKDFGFKDRKRVPLKGFPERWRLWEVTWRPEPEQVAVAQAPAVAARTPYVGRSEELAVLHQAVERAIAGTGGVALIGGEAGLGKTRLVDEIASTAKARGMFVVRGQCYDMEGAPPYAPFVEAIEYGLSVTTRPTFRSAMGDAGPEIARFVPKVRVAFPDLPPPVALPSDQARHYMFESVCDFFARASAVQPMLFVLEDLHWADQSTTELLERVARRVEQVPLLVVGTYRDVDLGPRDPFMTGIEHLARLPVVTRISLKRLNGGEVAAILRGLSGREPPERLVRLVFTETEGVPLFVEEVYRHLAEENRLFGASGDWLPEVEIGEIEVPETVRLVLGRRIDRIGETAQRIMAIASCIGHTFTFDFLVAVAEEWEDNVLDAIEEAERTRLVIAEGRRDPHFVFAHEQIRQTLLGRLSTVRRQRLHRRVANTLERLHGGRLDEHLSELAYHLVQAGAHERAAKYLHQAGTSAAARLATPEALDFFARAAELAGPGATRRAALRARGELLLNLFRGREATVDLEAAMREAAADGATAEEMEAWLRLGRAYYVVGLDHGPAVEQSLHALGRARDLAVNLGDKHAEARALIPTHWHVDFDPGYWPTARSNAKRALAIARELGDEDLEIDALNSANRTETMLVRQQHVERIATALERRGDLIALNEHLFGSMWTYYHAARFTDCVICCDRGTALAERLGIPPVQYGTLKSFALLDLGCFDAAWEALEQEVADEAHPFGRAFQRYGRILWYRAAGDPQRVLREVPVLYCEVRELKRMWMVPEIEAALAWAIAATHPAGTSVEALTATVRAAGGDVDQVALGRIDLFHSGFPGMFGQQLSHSWALAGEALILAQLHAGNAAAALEECERAIPQLDAEAHVRARWIIEELRIRALLALGRFAAVCDAVGVARAAAPLGWQSLLWRLCGSRAAALEGLGDDRAAAERRAAVEVLMAVADSLSDTSARARLLSQPAAAAVLA
jgi:class 3 adenylate cyclase